MPRNDQLALPKVQQELKAPAGLSYLSWNQEPYTCFTRDGRETLCGKQAPDAGFLKTPHPMGKPRCPECLRLANVAPQPNEVQFAVGHVEGVSEADLVHAHRGKLKQRLSVQDALANLRKRS